MSGDHVQGPVAQRGEAVVPGVSAVQMVAARCAESAGRRGVGDQPAERRGEPVEVAERDEQAGLAVRGRPRRRPPAAAATTGRPLAQASRKTIPNESVREGIAKTSSAA